MASSLLLTIPWKGSDSQLLVLLAIAAFIGYGLFLLIAKKDSISTPRKSLWMNPNTDWK